MSLLFTSDVGWIISHNDFIKKIYTEVKKDDLKINFKLHEVLFQINSKYIRTNQINPSNQNDEQSLLSCKKVRKKKYCLLNEKYDKLHEEFCAIKKKYEILISQARKNEIFKNNLNSELNTAALSAAKNCYESSGKTPLTNTVGENNNTYSVLVNINNEQYIFPPNCEFHCKDISHLKEWAEEISRLKKFDIIVLDPPWWNKYIRRKRTKCSSESYTMLNNENLKSLPINELLGPDGLLVIWCTNSDMHLNSLENDLFPCWNVKKIAKWYWLKVTINGDPVCDFGVPPRKQPFEQLIFAVRENRKQNLPPDGKIIISIPSALHSHKPPLCELIIPYVGQNSHCLEIFSRYLLPGWVSWGLETCRFQHISLFEEYT